METPTKFRRSGCSVEYHLNELKIALDPSDGKRCNPPPVPPDQRVLDLGCGAGQILIACLPDQGAFGVDIDLSALQTGQRLTRYARFACAQIEQLPFRTASFDVVWARVSLQYTDIRRSLAEIHRVLDANGTVWVVLQRFSLPFQTGLYRRPRFWMLYPYLLLNSAVFHFLGRSVSILGQFKGSYQVPSGVRRAFERAGFREITCATSQHLIVSARK